MSSMDQVCKNTLGNLLFENISLRAQNIDLQQQLENIEKRLEALTPKDVPEKGDSDVPTQH